MWWDLLPLDFGPCPPTKGEIFSALHYAFLAESGYKLRPKYGPDGSHHLGKQRATYVAKTTHQSQHYWIMDAIHAFDGRRLTLKGISKSKHPHEIPIGRFLTSGTLAVDPKNDYAPIYEVLQLPLDDDIEIIVMPQLHLFDSPASDSVGELLERFREIFELHRKGFSPVSPWLAPDCSSLIVAVAPARTSDIGHAEMTIDDPSLRPFYALTPDQLAAYNFFGTL
ncbi:hypothetical protein IW261DRAFT_1597831 [Armillaria novae-zelandiae]|uniref:Uncharacterized protein n=1 Tax=Armillaria novae-zelandiae TaxID=153914 RepID=A0AA39NS67_9AGAR|nr:hypothetical protein IW261DRAFT_1597831 [Armillaria novae-zelandiae]